MSILFKQNVYSGVYPDLDPLETPVNFFETDAELLKKYKLMRFSDIYETDLKAGSCLFIPAHYWF